MNWDKIIVDCTSNESIPAYISHVKEHCNIVQFGLDTCVEVLESNNVKKVFWDSKMYDVPHIVETYVNMAIESNKKHKTKISFMTICCHSDVKSIQAAVKLSEQDDQLRLLGITLLTSREKRDRNELIELIKIGMKQGLQGFICDYKDINLFRRYNPNGILVVTGISDLAKEEIIQIVQNPKVDFVVIGRGLKKLI